MFMFSLICADTWILWLLISSWDRCCIYCCGSAAVAKINVANCTFVISFIMCAFLSCFPAVCEKIIILCWFECCCRLQPVWSEDTRASWADVSKHQFRQSAYYIEKDTLREASEYICPYLWFRFFITLQDHLYYRHWCWVSIVLMLYFWIMLYKHQKGNLDCNNSVLLAKRSFLKHPA